MDIQPRIYPIVFTLTANAAAESNLSIIVTSYDFYEDSKTWDELQPFYQDQIQKNASLPSVTELYYQEFWLRLKFESSKQIILDDTAFSMEKE